MALDASVPLGEGTASGLSFAYDGRCSAGYIPARVWTAILAIPQDHIAFSSMMWCSTTGTMLAATDLSEGAVPSIA